MRDKILFEQLKQKYNVLPTPSVLREEIELKNNESSLKFTFSDKKDASPTDVLLKDQDLFFANCIGLFLLKESDAKRGSGVLQTYPNPIVFPDNTTSGQEFNNTDLNVIYNGVLDSVVDKDNVLDSFDTLRFYNAPETQKTATTAYSQKDGYYGFSMIEPVLKLNGDRKNSFILKIPSFSGVLVENREGNDTKHKVVLMLRGYILDGTSNRDLKAVGR